MRHLRNLVLLVAIATLNSLAVRAQQCYTPVTSWLGTYALSASATDAPCGTDTCSVDHSSSFFVYLNVLFDSSCSTLGWAEYKGTQGDLPVSVSLDDMLTRPCFGGGKTTQTIVKPVSPFSMDLLNLDVAGGTYTYNPAPIATATDNEVGCNGSTSTSSIPYPLYPISNWPKTYVLPPSVDTLSQNPPAFDADSLPGGGLAKWQFSFVLIPLYVWDDSCPPPWIVSSTIGCENQSLGEDIPVAGTGFSLHYEGDRAPGAGANAIASADASMIGGWTLNAHHAYDPGTNTLFLGDGRQRNGYHLGTPVSFNGNLLLTAEDGAEVYVFNGIRTAKHTVDGEREASLEIIRPVCASGSRLWA